MFIEFARAKAGSTIATIRRRDGVLLELPGYDRKHRVPHDLAHVVTERELGMSGGVFGSIASGAMFSNMRVVDGKQRHDAGERSKRLLKANREALVLAEIMAGVVHDAVEHEGGRSVCAEARRAWASVSVDPFPWTDQQLTDAVRRLAELAANYQRDDAVQVTWPDNLSNAVPDPPGIKRGRRGRNKSG